MRDKLHLPALLAVTFIENQEGRSQQSPKLCEAPHSQGRASRKGSFVHIVPLAPACRAGLAGHVPAKSCGQAPLRGPGTFNVRK
jgi:hypothetical protein